MNNQNEWRRFKPLTNYPVKLKYIDKLIREIGVEEIQDPVELKLMEFDEFNTARAYILYRQKHKIRRDAEPRLTDTYKEIFFTS
ncbi:MAG: hypothetical protein IJ774_12180 [Selenomonadaceae bacterium]|nr:hypothetical protein [Selenomonadaceae bacterium]